MGVATSSWVPYAFVILEPQAVDAILAMLTLIQSALTTILLTKKVFGG